MDCGDLAVEVPRHEALTDQLYGASWFRHGSGGGTRSKFRQLARPIRPAIRAYQGVIHDGVHAPVDGIAICQRGDTESRERREHPWSKLRSQGSIWQSAYSGCMGRDRTDHQGLPRALIDDVERAEQPRCVVAMEACGTAHGWGCEIETLGHGVRLIPPIYVKPCVKNHKNDMADAEAIAEAASRRMMRFAAVKTADQQARAVLFGTREMMVRQRTQLINALRGHLAEYGPVARAPGPRM